MLLRLSFSVFDLQQQLSAALQGLLLHEELTLVPNSVIFIVWDASFSSDNQAPVKDSTHPSLVGLGDGSWDGPQDLQELQASCQRLSKQHFHHIFQVKEVSRSM